MAKPGALPYGAIQKAAMRASGNTMMHHLQRGGGEIGPMNPHVMPFTKMKSAAIHAAQAGKLKKVPGQAEVQGDSTKNDKTLLLASPGEGIVPRSIMQGLPKAAEGGEVPPPDPGLLAKLRAWMQGQAQPEEVAEQMANKLPDALSIKGAVERKKKQLKDLDEQTKGQ